MGERDDRDEMTWVVFELTSSGERLAAEGALEAYLRKSLSCEESHPIFVPYLSFNYGTRVTVFNVMEGYAFVASGLDERTYFHVLNENGFLRNVLSTKVGRRPVLMTIPNAKVQELRDQLAQMIAVEIREGMTVEIVKGDYKGLEGKVIALTDEQAHVLLELRTLRTIRAIPRFALIPRGGDDDV